MATGMVIGRQLAVGALVLTVLAAACGDDPARRVSVDGDAGAGGEAGGPGSAGTGASAGVGAAAGAGGEAGGGAQARVDMATYCEAVGDGYYAWLTYCYGSEAYPEAEGAEFVQNTRESCLLAGPGVEAGRLAFDEVAAATCVAALDTMNCDGFDFIEGLAECRGVFSPLVEAGGDCFPGEMRHFSTAVDECLDSYCDVTGQACPGQCAPRKVDGESCLQSSECVPESYCNEVCVPRVADGEACSFGDACLLGSSCLTTQPEPDGICVPRSMVGQACDETEPCSFGFYCLGGECRSKVETGEACEVLRNCPDGDRCLDREGEGKTCGERGGHNVPCESAADCVEDHYCSGTAPKLCLPRIALGNPCSDGQCALGAWCNGESGECQAAGAAGDSCLMNGFPAAVAGACETGLACMSNGECQPIGAQGEPCSTTDMTTCEAGLFCSRVDFTCQPPGGEGELCNPYSTLSCSGDLACSCDDAACENYGGNPLVSDALHTCLPRRADGDACLSTNECAVGSSCIGDAALTCVPDPTDCLPE